MASIAHESAGQMMWDTTAEAWLAGSCGDAVTAKLGDGTCSSWTRHHELAWAKCESDCAWSPVTTAMRWHDADVVWQNANLDLDSVVGFSQVKATPYEANHELLWQSIDGLETSNLSRLVRIVRDWSVDVEEEQPVFDVDLAAQLDHMRPIETVEPVEPEVIDGRFISLLVESEHELLERAAGKDLWTWFSDWRDVFLSLAERFKALSGEEVFNLLKLALAARRAAPRARAPRQRQAPAERLLRLAKSIAPNAPPVPSHSEAPVIGAG